jgi:F420-dependent oxidoreductase-like protein
VVCVTSAGPPNQVRFSMHWKPLSRRRKPPNPDRVHLMSLKLGLYLGYWGIGPKGDDALEAVKFAESVGYESVWVAESYGSDCVSVLAWLAGQTEKINLGAAIMQVPARPPAAAAMAGATIDELSGGRFMFGFGPSGPQVSEGWYGVPYSKPWGRTKEYVEVVREIIKRDGKIDHQGEHYQVPMPGGQGKSLKLNFKPYRDEIPIFLGAIGRKSVEIAAEVADGWIPIFFSVDKFEEAWGEHIEAGLKKGNRQRSDLEISPSVQVAIDGDLEAARNMVRMGLVLYFGGMGSRKTNFYVDLAHRFGYGEIADEVQVKFQAGDKEGAFAACSDEVVNGVSLIGTESEVAERLTRFRENGIDRLIATPVHPEVDQMKHTVERLAALTA